jgi:hypothetical protein
VRLQAAGRGIHRLVHAVDHDYEAYSLKLAAIAAIVGLTALAYAGNSLAAYNPSLVVSVDSRLGGHGGVAIALRKGGNDDATGKVTLYSPLGYGVKLGHRAGIELGSFNGSVVRGTLGSPELIVGAVTTANPADYATSSCAPGAHEDVWILEFSLAGALFRWPIYVDRVTTAPEVTFASARMVTCLASPYVPPPLGSRDKLSLIGLIFGVSGVFTNPNTRGQHPWNALFVPYAPGTATLNPALTAQSTSYARLPVKLSAFAKPQKRGKQTFAVVTACLREAGQPISGIRVNFYRQKTFHDAPVKVGSTRSDTRGCATTRVLIRSKVMLVQTVFIVPWARTAPGCTPDLAARCSAPTIAQPQTYVRVLRVRR